MLPVSWFTLNKESDENSNKFISQRKFGFLLLILSLIIFFMPLFITFSDQPQWIFFLIFLAGLAAKILFSQIEKIYDLD